MICDHSGVTNFSPYDSHFRMKYKRDFVGLVEYWTCLKCKIRLRYFMFYEGKVGKVFRLKVNEK